MHEASLPPSVDVTGVWYGHWQVDQIPDQSTFTLSVTQDGANLSGTLVVPYVNSHLDDALTGTVEGAQVAMAAGDISLHGEATEVEASGTLTSVLGTGSWSAHRVISGELAVVESFYNGTGMQGIAFDGEHLWIASAGGLYQFDVNGNELAFFNHELGALTFDGVSLWAVAGYADQVKRIELDGSVSQTLDLPQYDSIEGIAHDGSNLWLLVRDGIGKEYVVQLDADGQELARFLAPGYAQYIAFQGDSLWLVCEVVGYFYKLTKEGVVTGVYRSPSVNLLEGLSGTQYGASDMTFDGSQMWYAALMDMRVYRLAP